MWICLWQNLTALRWPYEAYSEYRFPEPSPNSARFSYTTKEALFISAQLSIDAVSAIWKNWVLIRLWKQPSAQAHT